MKWILLILLISVQSWAQKENEVKTSPPKVIFKKTEKHQFSGAQLKGSLKKPELSYIYERKGLRQEKIVNIPENFKEEIADGANQF